MEYKGILKQRTKEKKLLIVVVSILVLIIAYTTKQYFYMTIAVLLLIANMHKKEHIVNEKGVMIKRNTLGMVSDNLWPWSEITMIQPDFIKCRPNVRITFQRGSTLRPMIFTPDDIEGILDLAEKMNPDIFIDYRTEEEQLRLERENNAFKKERESIQQEARARAKAKAKKR